MDETTSSKSPSYPDHTRLLEWRDDKESSHAVRTVQDWKHRRGDILIGMETIMGSLPAETCALDVRTHSTTQTEHYTRHKIDYQPEPGDRVPAYLLVPKNLTGKVPGIICIHQTVQIGKDEPAALGGVPNLHYADELARRGYVCLVPDYPSLGEYQYDFTKSPHPSGTIKGILNHKRGVDLLVNHPSVDSKRIGSIGHSLGGHNTMFLGAFDERVGAMVSCCGFTAFCRYYGGNITGWSGPRYMPRLTGMKCNEVPFDFHEIVASFAPRAFMAVAPIDDANFDNQGVHEVMDAASAVYKIFGAEENLVARYPDAKHDFPPEDRKAAYQFLDKHLSHQPSE